MKEKLMQRILTEQKLKRWKFILSKDVSDLYFIISPSKQEKAYQNKENRNKLRK